MDYTNIPSTNQIPNQHDYDQLASIYGHSDTFTSFLSKTATARASSENDIDTSNPSQWGKVVRKSSNGRSSLYERDLGKGKKVFTFVIWAD